jgi:hypothetical protein
VLHQESNPTTSRLVCVSDAEEVIDDRIDILRLDRSRGRKAKIGLQNLACNIRRLVTLERMAAA